MNKAMEALERFLELGGIKKDITLLVLSGAAGTSVRFSICPARSNRTDIPSSPCGSTSRTR